MTRVRAALLFVLMIAAGRMPACTDGMPLSGVIKAAREMAKANPRAAIHECYMPYFDDNDSTHADALTDAPPAVQEEFLLDVIGYAGKFAFQGNRQHDLRLICKAGEKYVLLRMSNQLHAPNVRRGRIALHTWGRALLLSNRLNDMLNTYEFFAHSGANQLSSDVAQLWEAALRCASDHEQQCAPKDYACALNDKCGGDPVVITHLKSDPGFRPRWEAYSAFLQAASEAGLILPGKSASIQSLVGQGGT
jgi:hypothetical protein